MQPPLDFSQVEVAITDLNSGKTASRTTMFLLGGKRQELSETERMEEEQRERLERERQRREDEWREKTGERGGRP